jgi:hypothetical protein
VPGAQAQIFMGGLAPAMTDPDFAAMKLVSTVLGGGLAGRFFSELRDKQALAYTTATQEPMRVDPGYFLALLGTAPDNVVKAEAALRDQLERIRREPVPDEELRVAKAYLLGSLAMDRRTNARQAWYLAALETQGRRVRIPRPLHGPGTRDDGGRSSARGPAVSRHAPHRGRRAAAQALERGEGPICFVGALDRTLNVQRVRLACGHRAPPRSWTLLLRSSRFSPTGS